MPENAHGEIRVSETSAALASRGAFSATVRYRVQGGEKTLLLRRFAPTEDEAKSALLTDLARRLAPSGTEVQAPMSGEEAVNVVGSALTAFRTFANWLHDNPNRSVLPESNAASDIALTGTDIVPKGIIEGLLGSVSDHLDAWVNLVDRGGDDPVMQLHLFADFTMLRPVVEALASIVWVLGDERQELRIRRALLIGNAELRHTQRFLDALNAAGLSDDALAYSSTNLEELLVEAAESAGLAPTKALPAQPTDPTAIVRGAGQYVRGPSLDTFRHWALCSSHAHGQIVGVLTHASRTIGASADGSLYSHAEVDTRHLAETLRFIGDKLLPTAVNLLNKRGFIAAPD